MKKLGLIVNSKIHEHRIRSDLIGTNLSHGPNGQSFFKLAIVKTALAVGEGMTSRSESYDGITDMIVGHYQQSRILKGKT